MIPFNKPYLTGKENEFIELAFNKGRFSGNGYFTKQCHSFFENQFNFPRCFLTNSATNALEMAAILCEIGAGDEVILPSYTFVSTATPFAMRQAKLVFCDNGPLTPNISAEQIEPLISERTKAIVVVHYAGMACDMDPIMELAEKHGIIIIEDAAHAITSKYKDRYLGTIGHLAAFSFHETKNISCGQGGMLIVNDERMLERAEIVWAKGTNRLKMERGIIAKYEWIDHGSNFYPSEITAAVLYAQLQEMDFIQEKRKAIWNHYERALNEIANEGLIWIPRVDDYQSNNYHIFYFLCTTKKVRDELLGFLEENGVLALFHYLSLHKSPFIQQRMGAPGHLPNADKFSDRTVRLPLFVELEKDEINKIIHLVLSFFGKSA